MKRTVLITGCSSGIGRATARMFACEGWNVVATMRDPNKEIELNQMNGVLVIRLDVQDGASIDRAIEAGIARFGRIDVLVNNAGYGQNGLFEATPREKIREQFDVNVFGVMDVTQAILPHFRANRSGMVINISSGSGFFTLPMMSLYCASKFALEGFSEAVAYELASQNIIVKLVEPYGGVTDTRFSERAARDNAEDPSLTDYDDFIARVRDASVHMEKPRGKSSDEIAKVIYEATTDGTDRIRYPVGDDAKGFLRASQELSGQAYVKFVKERFGLKPRP